MLSYITSFKSISFYCKIKDDLYHVHCYKILNTRNLNCENKQKIISQFKPTNLVYRLKLLQGYYHEYKNLFVFDDKIVHIQYIKYPQILKAFIKYRDKFNDIVAAYDLIPIFVELYNEQKDIRRFLNEKQLHNLPMIFAINDVTFKNYKAYKYLIQRARQEQNQFIRFGKSTNFSVQFGSNGEVRQINAYIKFDLQGLYKLMNFIY